MDRDFADFFTVIFLQPYLFCESWIDTSTIWAFTADSYIAVPILSVFPALIAHSELKSVHPGFPVAFIF